MLVFLGVMTGPFVLMGSKRSGFPFVILKVQTMTKSAFGLLLALTLPLAGCITPRPIPVGANTNTQVSVARSFVVKPTISPGLTTLTLPYNQASVDHLVIKIFSVEEGVETPFTEEEQPLQKVLTPDNFTEASLLANFKVGTTYRARAYAYATSDDTQLISDPNASYVDVSFTEDVSIALGQLTVLLVSRPKLPYSSLTLAGSTSGYLDGPGASAKFKNPIGLALDSAGNLFVADLSNFCIRKITSTGVVTTFAGNPGVPGNLDGVGTQARFGLPYGLTVDAQDNLYVSDLDYHSIRKIQPNGTVSTLAGGNGSGVADGTGTAAHFSVPSGLCMLNSQQLAVADTNNSLIRIVNIGSGLVETMAQASTSFNQPSDLTVSGNALYVADTGNNRIRRIANNTISTFAGSTTPGFVDATGALARFNAPTAIDHDSAGNIYVAEYGNNAIRRIDASGSVLTLAGKGATGSVEGIGTGSSFYHPMGIRVDSQHNIYVSDYHNNRIRKLQ